MTDYLTSRSPFHTHMNTSTMSLAILPSQPMAYSEAAASAPLRPSRSPAKRPKLSLDTNNVPSIFGKTSTSLRLETLSATSPTARNTFRNALDPTDLQIKKSNPRPSLSLLKTTTSSSPLDSAPVPTTTTTIESAASSATTTSSSSSIDSFPSVVPYKLAFNTVSILVNSPIPRTSRRAQFGHQKPMFPPPKKVAFREPLTEDVKTVRFTLRHSDIDSSTSTISTLELSATGEPQDQSVARQTKEPSEVVDRSRIVTSPQTGDKRESSDEDESDNDSCPATPVAGRRKRHRHWVWTLGPVDTGKALPSQHHQDVTNTPGEREALR